MNHEEYLKSDLGENYLHIKNICEQFSNSTFVDLGVREGISSSLLLKNAKEKNNKVFGIDVDFTPLMNDVSIHPQYTKICGDSVTIGRNWENKKIKVLFVDTFHIAEQVLCELYFWMNHMENESYIIFHDSHWPKGKHDVYGNIVWPRVDDGIKCYFGLTELENTSNECFDISCYPASWGMTVVKIKNKEKLKNNISNWNEIFERRNKLISIFWNEKNKENKAIDLFLTP